MALAGLTLGTVAFLTRSDEGATRRPEAPRDAPANDDARPSGPSVSESLQPLPGLRLPDVGLALGERVPLALTPERRFALLLELHEQRLRAGDGRAIVESLERLERECTAQEAEVEILRLAAGERLEQLDPALAAELYASFTSSSSSRLAAAAARLGDLRERSGRYAEACEAYEAALAHLDEVVGSPGPTSGPRNGVPGIPRVDEHRTADALSTCYEARGDLDRALLWAERARDRHPFETMCGNCAIGHHQRERARLGDLRERIHARGDGR